MALLRIYRALLSVFITYLSSLSVCRALLRNIHGSFADIQGSFEWSYYIPE